MDQYELANGITVALSGDEGDFVEEFANAVLGSAVAGAQGRAMGWRELTDRVEEALEGEIDHLLATAPRELRDATLGYLLRAAVIDTYQGLLDAVYPQWRAELMAEPDAPGAEPA